MLAPMEEWQVVCSTVPNASKHAKQRLGILKSTDFDLGQPARSPILSHRIDHHAIRNTSHLKALLSRNFELMGTVEWIMSCVLACVGSLGLEWCCRLKKFLSPLMKEGQDLRLQSIEFPTRPNSSKYCDVLEFKAAQHSSNGRM